MATKKTTTATENTAMDAVKAQMEAAKAQLATLGKKGFDLSEKSLDETAALGARIQDQGFDLMARNIDLMKLQMGFLVDNQTALLDLYKSQAEAVRKLVVEQAHEAIDGARARLN